MLSPGKLFSNPFSSNNLTTTAVEEKDKRNAKRTAIGMEKLKNIRSGNSVAEVINICTTPINRILFFSCLIESNEISNPRVKRRSEIPIWESSVKKL